MNFIVHVVAYMLSEQEAHAAEVRQDCPRCSFVSPATCARTFPCLHLC